MKITKPTAQPNGFRSDRPTLWIRTEPYTPSTINLDDKAYVGPRQDAVLFKFVAGMYTCRIEVRLWYGPAGKQGDPKGREVILLERNSGARFLLFEDLPLTHTNADPAYAQFELRLTPAGATDRQEQFSVSMDILYRP
jgi:hypothetical protein